MDRAEVSRATERASGKPAPGISMSAGALASLIGADLRGDASRELSAIDPLESAAEHALSFIRDVRHAHGWRTTNAGAVLVSRRVIESEPELFVERSGRALLIVEDADLALLGLLQRITPPIEQPAAGVHPGAAVDPSVVLGEGVRIGPGVVIGPGSMIGEGSVLHAGVSIGAGVQIGPGCDLRPRVVVMDRCVLGARCVLHPGVVIGADGFGYRPDPGGGAPIKIPHAGGVRLGDDVEIGANSAIDRGKLGDTTIGDGTKIDNLVQIGHNCIIGRGCVICGNCGLAGSVRVGDGATLAGGVGVADGRSIGARATVGARAGVMHDVPPGEMWLGSPARPARQTMRQISAIEALPDLIKTVRKMLRLGGGGDGGRER